MRNNSSTVLEFMGMNRKLYVHKQVQIKFSEAIFVRKAPSRFVGGFMLIKNSLYPDKVANMI